MRAQPAACIPVLVIMQSKSSAGTGCTTSGHANTPAKACTAAAGVEGVRQDTQIWHSSSPADQQPISLSARLAQLPELLAAYRAAKLASEPHKAASEASKRLQVSILCSRRA